jgi:hypothetical protein
MEVTENFDKIPDGKYEGYFYGYCCELEDGRKLKLDLGVRCTKKYCGGLRPFELKGNEVYCESVNGNKPKTFSFITYEQLGIKPPTYSDKVRVSLVDIISRMNGISEKSYTKYDEVSKEIKELISDKEIHDMIQRFESLDCRTEYCAEVIYFHKCKDKQFSGMAEVAPLYDIHTVRKGMDFNETTIDKDGFDIPEDVVKESKLKTESKNILGIDLTKFKEAVANKKKTFSPKRPLDYSVAGLAWKDLWLNKEFKYKSGSYFELLKPTYNKNSDEIYIDAFKGDPQDKDGTPKYIGRNTFHGTEGERKRFFEWLIKIYFLSKNNYTHTLERNSQR